MLYVLSTLLFSCGIGHIKFIHCQLRPNAGFILLSQPCNPPCLRQTTTFYSHIQLIHQSHILVLCCDKLYNISIARISFVSVMTSIVDLTQPKYSPVFSKIRTITFSCIILTTFLWILLLCLLVFAKWDILDSSQRTLIVLLLLTNTMTVIILIVLIIKKFRPWLDAARCFLLLVLNCGIAGAYAFWSGKFSCLSKEPDDIAMCSMTKIYILAASWVVPILIIGYCCGLGLMVHRYRKAQAQDESSEGFDEKLDWGNSWNNEVPPQSARPSLLPMMQPNTSIVPSPLSVSFPPNATYTPPPLMPAMPITPVRSAFRESRTSRATRISHLPPVREVTEISEINSNGSPPTVGRLSKLSRMSMYRV
ncbi:hypothetical protein BDQ17DRAFT_1354556 [Cyathus striatus]|nr:hypothetical protein BDQ17DRAFT_1354556 [Cyathus striatus]